MVYRLGWLSGFLATHVDAAAQGRKVPQALKAQGILVKNMVNCPKCMADLLPGKSERDEESKIFARDYTGQI